jgi:hypothetical protein
MGVCGNLLLAVGESVVCDLFTPCILTVLYYMSNMERIWLLWMYGCVAVDFMAAAETVEFQSQEIQPLRKVTDQTKHRIPHTASHPV